MGVSETHFVIGASKTCRRTNQTNPARQNKANNTERANHRETAWQRGVATVKGARHFYKLVLVTANSWRAHQKTTNRDAYSQRPETPSIPAPAPTRPRTNQWDLEPKWLNTVLGGSLGPTPFSDWRTGNPIRNGVVLFTIQSGKSKQRLCVTVQYLLSTSTSLSSGCTLSNCRSCQLFQLTRRVTRYPR